MPGDGRSEVYFIAGMMVLIVILCVIACVVFVRTYKKEMRAKAEQAKVPAEKPETVEQ